MLSMEERLIILSHIIPYYIIDYRIGKILGFCRKSPCSSVVRDNLRSTFVWVFDRCVSETMCFGGGTLLGVISPRPNAVLHYAALQN